MSYSGARRRAATRPAHGGALELSRAALLPCASATGQFITTLKRAFGTWLKSVVASAPRYSTQPMTSGWRSFASDSARRGRPEAQGIARQSRPTRIEPSRGCVSHYDIHMKHVRTIPLNRLPRSGRQMTRREVKKRETRERILHAAASLARREGLPAASIPRVMSAAGLTVGGFYGHFRSKAAMDAEVIRTVFGAISGRSLAHLDGYHGFDWVQRAFERYLTPLNRDHPEGCAYPNILSHIATGPPEVKKAFADALDLRIRAFEAHMPSSPGVSVRERAVAAMALTIGALILARASAGAVVSDEVLAACQKWALPELNMPAQRRRRA